MAKTYIPGGVTVVEHTSRYLNRWQAKMTIGASPEQVAALVDLIACVAVFLSKWHKPTPVN